MAARRAMVRSPRSCRAGALQTCGRRVLLAIVLMAWAPAFGDDERGMAHEAIEAYGTALEASDPARRVAGFRRARRLFEQVVRDAGVANAALYVNLGNAALQCDEAGTAVLAYRRALSIEPGHPQARANLEHARRLLPDWVPRPGSAGLLDTFFFWFRTLSRAGRELAAALCFAAAALLLALGIGWQRPWARNAALLPALVWMALTGVGLWSRWAGPIDDVVVTVPEAVARSADASGAPPRFAEPLPAGTEARVLERRAHWVRIQLADGRHAWVRTSSVTPVAAPSP